MRNMTIITGFLFALLATILPQLAFAADSAPKQGTSAQDLSNTPPDATIDFDAKQLRLIFGGATGTGVLHYKGKDYNFSIKGNSLGGAGYTEVQGTGTVHFLKNLTDFEGAYTGIGAGAAVGGGKGGSSFQNSKGVVVSTKSKAEGLALNLGVSAIEVKLIK